MMKRAGRYLFSLFPGSRILQPGRWRWLRYYPAVVPEEGLLRCWSRSEWPDYQRWIDCHDIVSLRQWRERHHQAKPPGVGISIVTPVHETPAEILRQCILSVRMQTSPYWEWILVDDASQSPETRAVLDSPLCRDPRIRVFDTGRRRPRGISAATNVGIEKARGDFIVFLDHDDRLAWDAIQSLAEVLEDDPRLDILYSDRDMLSPQNRRTMHLMKPDWSPETLLSGNYVFHLMAYRKRLIQQVGGLRSDYDGSQDYDLILRCAERTDRVRHIPRVLYHWRQHAASVSLDDGVKAYAFDAGVRALTDALRRRGLQGAVSEDPGLWRGHYRISLPRTGREEIARILLSRDLTGEKYARLILSDPALGRQGSYLLIRPEEVEPMDDEAESELVSWLTLRNVGLVTGRTLDRQGRNLYAGAILSRTGEIRRPYYDFPAEEPGYMAVTSILRNLSVPDPFCVAIRRDLWEGLGGLDSRYRGPHGMVDFALRAQARGWRILYVPSARFQCQHDPWAGRFLEEDKARFTGEWWMWLQQGDPAYNPNLSESSDRYELDLESDESTSKDLPQD